MGGHKVERLFAYIALEGKDEGLCVFHSDQFGVVPMLGADTARADRLKSIAQNIANTEQIEITLYEFSAKRLIEVIKPDEVKG